MYQNLCLPANQQHARFHVVRPRELVKYCAALNPVCIVQLGDVLGQCRRVARDIKDIVETTGQLAGIRVHARTRRVNDAFLPGIELDSAINVTSDLADLADCDLPAGPDGLDAAADACRRLAAAEERRRLISQEKAAAYRRAKSRDN